MLKKLHISLPDIKIYIFIKCMYQNLFTFLFFMSTVVWFLTKLSHIGGVSRMHNFQLLMMIDGHRVLSCFQPQKANKLSCIWNSKLDWTFKWWFLTLLARKFSKEMVKMSQSRKGMNSRKKKWTTHTKNLDLNAFFNNFSPRNLIGVTFKVLFVASCMRDREGQKTTGCSRVSQRNPNGRTQFPVFCQIPIPSSIYKPIVVLLRTLVNDKNE